MHQFYHKCGKTKAGMERIAMTVHRARCGSNGKADLQSADCDLAGTLALSPPIR